MAALKVTGSVSVLFGCVLASAGCGGIEDANPNASEALSSQTASKFDPLRLSANESSRGVSGRISLKNGLLSFSPPEGGAAESDAVCLRTPFGPGLVNWYFYNPSSWGYSVKPESAWSLIWAAPPSQGIDGIYNRAWGSTALKVPDSCTVDFSSPNDFTYCCNAAAWAAGYRMEWVVPGNIAWPPRPL